MTKVFKKSVAKLQVAYGLPDDEIKTLFDQCVQSVEVDVGWGVICCGVDKCDQGIILIHTRTKNFAAAIGLPASSVAREKGNDDNWVDKSLWDDLDGFLGGRPHTVIQFANFTIAHGANPWCSDEVLVLYGDEQMWEVTNPDADWGESWKQAYGVADYWKSSLPGPSRKSSREPAVTWSGDSDIDVLLDRVEEFPGPFNNLACKRQAQKEQVTVSN